MNFGRGLKPTTPGRTAHRLGGPLHPLIGAQLKAGINGSADLTASLPAQRFNQGKSETCFWHSAAALAYLRMQTLGQSLGFVPSPLLGAEVTYALVRARSTPPGAPLAPLQDTGAELQDAADAGAQWGVGPIRTLIQGRYSDVPDDDGYAFPEPDKSALVIAGKDLLGGEYSIAVDSSAAETCAASLDVGIPIWTGGLVGAAYQALTANGIAEPTPSNDATKGGHAQGIVGYKTTGGGALLWRVVNSWGPGWADNGLVWASTDWLLSMWELWPFDCKVAA